MKKNILILLLCLINLKSFAKTDQYNITRCTQLGETHFSLEEEVDYTETSIDLDIESHRSKSEFINSTREHIRYGLRPSRSAISMARYYTKELPGIVESVSHKRNRLAFIVEELLKLKTEILANCSKSKFSKDEVENACMAKQSQFCVSIRD